MGPLIGREVARVDMTLKHRHVETRIAAAVSGRCQVCGRGIRRRKREFAWSPATSSCLAGGGL